MELTAREELFFGQETEYEYAKAFVQLLYRDYDWQFGAWACLEGADAKSVRLARGNIKAGAPKLVREYFLAKRDNAGLDAFMALPPEKRLDASFETMGDALLRAREDFGRVLEVQFALTDRFLYAAWMNAGAETACRLMDKFNSKAFRFPNVDFDVQLESCYKSAKKAAAAYSRDKDNVMGSYESVLVHFGYTNDLIDLWKGGVSKGPDAKYAPELEKRVWAWNAMHYAMPLYVANKTPNFDKPDEKFEDLAKELFSLSKPEDYEILTGKAMSLIREAAEKIGDEPVGFGKLKGLASRAVTLIDKSPFLSEVEKRAKSNVTQNAQYSADADGASGELHRKS